MGRPYLLVLVDVPMLPGQSLSVKGAPLRVRTNLTESSVPIVIGSVLANLQRQQQESQSDGDKSSSN